MSRAPEFLHNLPQALAWLRARVTGQLRTDSRQVQPGDGFIAWPGGVTDGRQHVASAIARGAVACLVEHDGVEAFSLPGAVASYRVLKAATAELAAQWCSRACVSWGWRPTWRYSRKSSPTPWRNRCESRP